MATGGGIWVAAGVDFSVGFTCADVPAGGRMQYGNDDRANPAATARRNPCAADPLGCSLRLRLRVAVPTYVHLVDAGRDISKPQRSLSRAGLEFIIKHEGFRRVIYGDSARKPTIGNGHLIRTGENFSHGVTRAMAERLLEHDVRIAVRAADRMLPPNVTQTQFDVVVDFAFNLGPKSLNASTLLKDIRKGGPVPKRDFTIWNHAAHREVPGLTRRREDEYDVYSRDDSAGD